MDQIHALWCPFVKGCPASSARSPFVKGFPHGSFLGCMPFVKASNDQATQASMGFQVSGNVQDLGTAVSNKCAERLGFWESKLPHDHVIKLSLVWNSQPSPWIKSGMVFDGMCTLPLDPIGFVSLGSLGFLNTCPKSLALSSCKNVFKGLWIKKRSAC